MILYKETNRREKMNEVVQITYPIWMKAQTQLYEMMRLILFCSRYPQNQNLSYYKNYYTRSHAHEFSQRKISRLAFCFVFIVCFANRRSICVHVNGVRAEFMFMCVRMSRMRRSHELFPSTHDSLCAYIHIRCRTKSTESFESIFFSLCIFGSQTEMRPANGSLTFKCKMFWKRSIELFRNSFVKVLDLSRM